MRTPKFTFDFLWSRISFLKQHILQALLLVALFQGLVYVFLIPPWWHYDEPGHFEFAWQIAHFDHWPRFGEIDESMRRRLAPSLIRYGFYDLLGGPPDLKSNEPINIGVAPQTSNYPLYYIVASLPLRVLGDVDFTIQDRVLRLVSLGMFLLTLWVTWKALGEILPEGHPVQWMTVLFLALLPGFADTMVAINDDVGAVLAFSLFVWASLRLLRRGPSLWGVASVLIGAALCYWTKTTAWPALALVPIVFLLAVLRGKWSWMAYAVITLGVVAGLLVSLRWDDPALWYRGTRQTQDIRSQETATPFGKYSFYLHGTQGQAPWIGQFVSISDITSLRGKTVTLGAWIWADRPTPIQMPTLRVTLHGSSNAPTLVTVFNTLDSSARQLLTDSSCSLCVGQIKQSIAEKIAADAQPWVISPSEQVALTTTPVFYSISFQAPSDGESGWVEFIPFPSTNESGTGNVNQDATVYFDDPVMVLGERKGTPNFDSPLAQSGTWGGKPFHNLIRNASAEATWARLSPSGEKILDKIFVFGNPSIFLASLQDWTGTNQYYRGIVSSLFQTFWAKPAISKVSLLGGDSSYSILLWLTALSLFGALILMLRKARSLPWPIVLFLGMVLIGVWGLTLARGGIEVIKSYGVLPWARYAFPTAIPTALLLCIGWREGLRWLGRWFGISTRQQASVFIAFFVGVDILAMLSVAHYFYWKSGQEYLILFVALVLAVLLGINALGQKTSLPADPGKG